MPFVEDPARFSKSRLKSDLVAHNVALPPAASKKDVYVELHLKHIERNQTADFSSDEEEEQERNVAEDEKLPDPRSLTDDELRGALLRYGVKAGPIVASTRSVYENKLRKLLQPDGRVELNGADDAVLYSDSEEDIQEHGVQDDEESGSEEELLIVELTKNAHQKSKQLPQKRVNEVLEDIYKDAEKTPTGMSVTRRRPIKGAAQRPVEFQYPDTPVSPMTFARREVERRLVPIHIQIVFYVFLVGILYLVYVNVDESSFDKLKDRLRLIQWSGSDETHSLQLEMDVIDVAYGQE
ncbi:LEM domain-containing protein 1 isoform X2 [Gouania willdenowi]|uniref:Lamina-associated polypeptide 2, isoforms beta/gamma-like n=1 Tax=Gouania willdenowi TaxID=441366 RepID=A0A8C5D8K9_GOUWI|nr:lamina-associated polypeptide 2, isoforms beta/gamma-like isoform X2 [Gouania willdenowi]